MTTLTSHEQFCLDTADYFTAIRGRTPASRTRKEFATIDEAAEYAAGFGDGKTMIYAITETGNSAHICNF